MINLSLISQERAALAAASDSYRYVEKRKPIPDPQVCVVVKIFIYYYGETVDLVELEISLDDLCRKLD